jgi:diaminopimelate epimerase
MMWSFTKMQGAGNDFVVLDGVSQPIEMTAERARALAHRQFGVGCDQILLVETPLHPDADFRYRIFNADGGEVEHCGNGARCFVRFVHQKKLSSRNPIRAEIVTGLITLLELESGEVQTEMGQTRFNAEALPFDTTGLPTRTAGQDTLYGLTLPNNATVWLSLVALSNPHAVQVVDNVAQAPVAEHGPLIESHPRFAKRVNAGFMQIINPNHIRLRVYERGAGETLACGTGACAAVVSGIRQGLLTSPVTVDTHGGQLLVGWDGSLVHLTGPATMVFEGSLDIDRLVDSIPTFE